MSWVDLDSMAMVFFWNSTPRDLLSSSWAFRIVAFPLPLMLGYSLLMALTSLSQKSLTTSIRPFLILSFHPPASAGGMRRSLATFVRTPVPVTTLDVATLLYGKTQSMFRPVPVM